jgi:hypothetical protein
MRALGAMMRRMPGLGREMDWLTPGAGVLLRLE